MIKKRPFANNNLLWKVAVLCFSIALPTIGLEAQGNSDSTKPQYQWQDLKGNQKFEILLQEKKDSLKMVLADRWVIGLHYGWFFMPSYLKTEADKITGVDLTASNKSFGISAEYFTNNHFAIGLDVNMQTAKQVMTVTSGTNGYSFNISGGGGSTTTSFLYGKYFLGKQRKSVTNSGLYNNDPILKDINSNLAALNNANTRLMAKPKLYCLAGLGYMQTMLIKVKGDPTSSISIKSYEQSGISGKIGIGVFSRFSRLLVFDASCQYIYSKPYDPSLGGVSAYSGVLINLKLAVILKGGFKIAKERMHDGYYGKF